MQSKEITLGRTFCITFNHEADFFTELNEFCEVNDVKQGYIPMFIAGFKEVELVGTCDRQNDENAPVWSKVFLRNVEVLGAGTITFDEDKNKIVPHIHVTVGQKFNSATANTSHLLSAKVLFLVEMILVEVASPILPRIKDANLYDIALLNLE